MKTISKPNGSIDYIQFTIGEFMDMLMKNILNIGAGMGFYANGTVQSNERVDISQTDIVKVCESKKYTHINWYWVERCVN